MAQGKRHKRTVKKTARKLKSNGWNTKADNVKGFKDPKPIRGRTPDITATKGNKKKIIEVETPKSMKRDKKQRATFKKHAAKRKNTTYKTKKTQKRKK